MLYSRIMGTGSALPKRVVTNLDLEKLMDTNDQWIRDRTGICERRIIGPGESTTTLALEACRNAMEAAAIDPHEIDLFVLGTTTPDLIFPSSACLLQKELGLRDVGAMDINAACSGFIYALETGSNYIKSGNYKYIAVIGADKMSTITNYKDRNLSLIHI